MEMGNERDGRSIEEGERGNNCDLREKGIVATVRDA